MIKKTLRRTLSDNKNYRVTIKVSSEYDSVLVFVKPLHETFIQKLSRVWNGYGFDTQILGYRRDGESYKQCAERLIKDIDDRIKKKLQLEKDFNDFIKSE